MKNEEAIVGIDIGSSHVKTIILNKTNFNESTTFIYPIWAIAENAGIKSKKEELIFRAVTITLRKLQEQYRFVHANIVTSLEAAFPFLDVISQLKSIEKNLSNINFYTITNNLVVIPIDDIAHPNRMSSIRSIQYIAEKILNDGILIHMNSASTVIVPVVNGVSIEQKLHYSSGIGLWVGALLTPVFQVSNKCILFGDEFLTSPANVYLYDILPNILPEQKLQAILEIYNVPIQLGKEKDKKNKKASYFRLLQYLGCFPEEVHHNLTLRRPYNMENQVKIASMYLYHKFLNTTFENILKVLSRVDISLSNLEIIISGIGKEFALPDSLYLFRNKLTDIEMYIPKPYCIVLEAFGAALSLYELLEDVKLSKEEIQRRFR